MFKPLKILPNDGCYSVSERMPEPNTQLYIKCAENADSVGGGAATYGDDGKWYWTYDWMRDIPCEFTVTHWCYFGYPGPTTESIEYLTEKYKDKTEV